MTKKNRVFGLEWTMVLRLYRKRHHLIRLYKSINCTALSLLASIVIKILVGHLYVLLFNHDDNQHVLITIFCHGILSGLTGLLCVSSVVLVT